MVSGRRDAPGPERAAAAPADDEAVGGRPQAHAERRQLLERGEPVALLDAQLARALDLRLPVGQRGRHREHGELVDRGRHLARANRRRVEGGRADDERGARLARLLVHVHDVDRRAHAAQDLEIPEA